MSQIDPSTWHAIRRVLRHDWNPIGVEGLPEDEYDRYIEDVHRLLSSGPSDQQVAEHLDWIETEWISLPRPDKSELLPIARRLLALQVMRRDG